MIHNSLTCSNCYIFLSYRNSLAQHPSHNVSMESMHGAGSRNSTINREDTESRMSASEAGARTDSQTESNGGARWSNPVSPNPSPEKMAIPPGQLSQTSRESSFVGEYEKKG
jgi:hypothetical protein